MKLINVEKLSTDEIKKRGIYNWPVWEKQVSVFPWSYDTDEECLIIEGKVEIEAQGEKIQLTKGDFVTFKKGLTCTWNILSDVKKHYNFP